MSETERNIVYGNGTLFLFLLGATVLRKIIVKTCNSYKQQPQKICIEIILREVGY